MRSDSCLVKGFIIGVYHAMNVGLCTCNILTPWCGFLQKVTVDMLVQSPGLFNTLRTDRYFFLCIYHKSTASVVEWSEFLATDTEVPGSISGATRFSE
jgi:hypothetical protein